MTGALLHWYETLDGSVLSLLQTEDDAYAAVKLYSDLEEAAAEGTAVQLISPTVASELKGLNPGFGHTSVMTKIQPKLIFGLRYGWIHYRSVRDIGGMHT